MRSYTYHFYLTFLIISTLFYTSITQAPMSMSANQKYSYCGRLAIDTRNLTNYSHYSVTYPKSMVSSNTVAYVSFGQLKLSLVGISQILIKISLAYVGASSMTVLIQSTIYSSIFRLAVNYLLIKWEDSFRDAYQSNFMMQQIENHQINSTVFIIYLLIPLNRTVNSTGILKSFTFLNGLQMSYQFISIFTFSTSSYLRNNSYFNITFTLNQAINGNFSFIICVYNQNFNNDTNNILNFRIDSYILQERNQNPFVLYPLNTQITASNVFIGLSSFTIKDQFFSIETFSNASGIILSSDQAFIYYGFTYLVIQSKYCPLNLSYFNPFQNRCDNKCSRNFIQNDYTLFCLPSPTLSIIFGSLIVFYLICTIFYVVYRQHKACRYSQKGQQTKQIKEIISQNKNSGKFFDPSVNLQQTKEIKDKYKVNNDKDKKKLHFNEEEHRLQIELQLTDSVLARNIEA